MVLVMFTTFLYTVFKYLSNYIKIHLTTIFFRCYRYFISPTDRLVLDVA